MMKTGHTGCNTAYHHATGGGPAAASSVHNAILTPGTRLSSVCSGQHRLRKKLRRLWEPNQLQDVRLHRIQVGEAGLDPRLAQEVLGGIRAHWASAPLAYVDALCTVLANLGDTRSFLREQIATERSPAAHAFLAETLAELARSFADEASTG